MQFEYKIIMLQLNLDDELILFNELGLQKWELVSVYLYKNNISYAYFKRQING